MKVELKAHEVSAKLKSGGKPFICSIGYATANLHKLDIVDKNGMQDKIAAKAKMDKEYQTVITNRKILKAKKAELLAVQASGEKPEKELTDAVAKAEKAVKADEAASAKKAAAKAKAEEK